MFLKGITESNNIVTNQKNQQKEVETLHDCGMKKEQRGDGPALFPKPLYIRLAQTAEVIGMDQVTVDPIQG